MINFCTSSCFKIRKTCKQVENGPYLFTCTTLFFQCIEREIQVKDVHIGFAEDG